jgi:Na+/H+ antiporter NhaC
MFGMLIMLFERSGAVHDFGRWASKFIKTRKQALIGTFALGVVIFLDDYLNKLAVGTTMKGITDKMKIPRTQLGYVVNSVAAPVCILIPLSSWAVFFAALLENEGILGADGTGMGAYISAIPLTFYGWIAVLVVLLQIFGVIPKLGSIKKDTIRAEATGDVFPEGSDLPALHVSEVQAEDEKKALPVAFLLPLLVMIVVTLLTGIDVLMGAISGVAVAIIQYSVTKRLTIKELLTSCFDGAISMGFVLILSVLAFAVQAANTDLMLAEFVIGVTVPIMKGAFLPAVVFIVCALYAYTTGCFWDLAAIIIPIVVPLAAAMGVNPILASAAVFSGATFGSNTCLYGDGIILCSQGCQIKAVELMLATLPYALIAGGISVVLYLITGFVM